VFLKYGAKIMRISDTTKPQGIFFSSYLKIFKEDEKWIHEDETAIRLS
jgi:hypothetical protein